MSKSEPSWAEVSAILDQLLDAPEADRPVLIAQLTGDNKALRSEVTSMLAACEDSESDSVPLDLELGGLADDLVAAEEHTHPTDRKRRFGPYVLEEKIGHGGMGLVFLGRRVEGDFDQTVAVKLLPPALQTEDFERRFKSERQILADLTHVNIAQLLDGGLGEDETPYFVMEFIEGIPIDEYCRIQSLELRERLQLFRKVCSAVSFAHQNLVVHRDLKPANILVDANGEPKLLDFGIAKLLDSSDPGALDTIFTALTPTHAAPEQFLNQNVTTQTDVFALGVLLYQLLTNELPLEFSGLSPSAAAKMASENTPEAPSQRLRVINPSLARRLAGDLDSVVFQAMRKQPRNRYHSVLALMDDLDRYLDQRPVSARPNTWHYRAGKFLKRHRVGVAVSLLLSGVLVAGVTGIVWQEQKALREAAKSAQIAAFLASIFDGANPFAQWQDEPSLRELLTAAIERTEVELVDQPAVQAEMLRLLGVATTGLGDYEQARKLLDRALQIRETSEPTNLTGLVEIKRDLGTVMIEQGEFEEAQALSKDALLQARTLAPPDQELVGDALVNLAVAQSRAGNHESAENYYREAISLRESTLPPNDYRIGNALASLGAMLSTTGNAAEGIQYSQRALENYQLALGENNPLTLRAKSDLASTMFLQGQYEPAGALFEQLLSASRTRLGDRHPELVLPMNNLGRVLSEQCRFLEADEHLSEAIRLAETNIAQGQPLRLATEFNFGSVQFELGNLDDAAHYISTASRGYESLIGPEHPVVIRSRIRLAEVLWYQGRQQDAAELLTPLVAKPATTPADDNMALAYLLLARMESNADVAGALLNRLNDAWQGESAMLAVRRAELQVAKMQQSGKPVPSNIKQNLREWLPEGSPRLVKLALGAEGN